MPSRSVTRKCQNVEKRTIDCDADLGRITEASGDTNPAPGQPQGAPGRVEHRTKPPAHVLAGVRNCWLLSSSKHTTDDNASADKENTVCRLCPDMAFGREPPWRRRPIIGNVHGTGHDTTHRMHQSPNPAGREDPARCRALGGAWVIVVYASGWGVTLLGGGVMRLSAADDDAGCYPRDSCLIGVRSACWRLVLIKTPSPLCGCLSHIFVTQQA
jgi:hypothetical protein